MKHRERLTGNIRRLIGPACAGKCYTVAEGVRIDDEVRADLLVMNGPTLCWLWWLQSTPIWQCWLISGLLSPASRRILWSLACTSWFRRPTRQERALSLQTGRR